MELTSLEIRSIDHNGPEIGVNVRKPRPLIYDEKKAAEAAFRAEPFNPAWSTAAQNVYDGIAAAMAKMEIERIFAEETESEEVAA